MESQRLHLTVGDDNQSTVLEAIARLRGSNNLDAANRYCRRKRLYLLDHDWTDFLMRIGGLGIYRLDHLAVIRTDEKDVIGFATRGLHLRIHGDLSESVTGSIESRYIDVSRSASSTCEHAMRPIYMLWFTRCVSLYEKKKRFAGKTKSVYQRRAYSNVNYARIDAKHATRRCAMKLESVAPRVVCVQFGFRLAAEISRLSSDFHLLETGAYNDRLTEKARHRLVHQRVRVDEVERQIRQCARVVGALTRPRVRHLRVLHRQPVGVHGALLLEIASEGVGDVLQRERAHRRAAYAVHWRREGAVNELGRRAAVLARYQLGRWLCDRDIP